MLKRRVIPVLLLRGGRCVKGRQFTDFRDTGDPVMATRVYNAQAADTNILAAIDEMAAGKIDAIALTSSPQARRLFEVARQHGREDAQHQRPQRIHVQAADRHQPDQVRPHRQRVGAHEHPSLSSPATAALASPLSAVARFVDPTAVA